MKILGTLPESIVVVFLEELCSNNDKPSDTTEPVAPTTTFSHVISQTRQIELAFSRRITETRIRSTMDRSDSTRQNNEPAFLAWDIRTDLLVVSLHHFTSNFLPKDTHWALISSCELLLLQWVKKRSSYGIIVSIGRQTTRLVFVEYVDGILAIWGCVLCNSIILFCLG